jgi:hypothetical protein
MRCIPGVGLGSRYGWGPDIAYRIGRRAVYQGRSGRARGGPSSELADWLVTRWRPGIEPRLSVRAPWRAIESARVLDNDHGLRCERSRQVSRRCSVGAG